MLVFLDESGDAGFKVARGSSPVFCVAMVIFASGEDARHTQERLSALLRELRVKPEFKFNRCSAEVRDQFFSRICGCPFTVRAIAVRKDIIRSENLKDDTERFYSYFVKQLMKFDNGTLAKAKVRIDGSGEREFKQQLSANLRKHLGERIRDVRFADSRADPLIQLADMCAGAIARSRRDDRSDCDRWRLMLKPRIQDIWDFE